MRSYYLGMGSKGGKTYHSVVSPVNKKNPLIGIEFECNTRGKMSDNIKQAFAIQSLDFIPTSDLSLPRGTGAEFISKPVEYRKVVSNNGAWKWFLKRAEKFVVNYASAGMHINIQSNDDTHERKAAWACNIMWRIGARVCGLSSQYNYWRFNSIPLTSYNKGHAAATRSGRVEFRFARTTTDWQKFKMQVKYSRAIMEFADSPLIPNRITSERDMTVAFQTFLRGAKGYSDVLEIVDGVLDDWDSLWGFNSPIEHDTSPRRYGDWQEDTPVGQEVDPEYEDEDEDEDEDDGPPNGEQDNEEGLWWCTRCREYH